ncbi:MAG: CPBP family intramembrane metalloprotease [Bacteroidales bacterium]|nr:CPBP family intramembrane metalloprotease [Bacteroidales bacterium]
MVEEKKKLYVAISVAALLWFYMFSPWTNGKPGFWIVMSFSAVVLTALAIVFTPDRKELFKIDKPFFQIVGGVGLALVLWGIFWVGDKLSALMFDFARPEVDAVYSMKRGFPQWLIAVLLLVLIGPAEEFFWRGYVQRTFSKLIKGKNAPVAAFCITSVIYALVHVWSFNFMLIMAALVAGVVWGFVYRINPKTLPALIISHSLWDALVFVILPI